MADKAYKRDKKRASKKTKTAQPKNLGRKEYEKELERLKTWKLSSIDIKSYNRWDEYTRARDEMFKASDTPWAPWFVAKSEDKRRVRLNVISHLLDHIPYEELPSVEVKLGKRKIGKYEAANYPFKYVPERY